MQHKSIKGFSHHQVHLKSRTGSLLDSVPRLQWMAAGIKNPRDWNNKKILLHSICTICAMDLSLFFLGFYHFLVYYFQPTFLHLFPKCKGFLLIVESFCNSFTGMLDGLFSFTAERKVGIYCNFILLCQQVQEYKILIYILRGSSFFLII